MKSRLITCAMLLCSLAACSFFDDPLNDISSTPVLATHGNTPASPVVAPPPLLPSPSQDNKLSTAEPSESTYFTVATIFDVPADVPNLSFIHFTDRSKRREKILCEALLNTYPITPLAELPSGAQRLIIWPIEEGATANNCNAMISAHEPLDVSQQTAQSVNSKGPYALSRNSSVQKQLIYDFSAINTTDLIDALTEWQQVLNAGAQNWSPVVKAK